MYMHAYPLRHLYKSAFLYLLAEFLHVYVCIYMHIMHTVAQLVAQFMEHLPSTQNVVGSSPA